MTMPIVGLGWALRSLNPLRRVSHGRIQLWDVWPEAWSVMVAQALQKFYFDPSLFLFSTLVIFLKPLSFPIVPLQPTSSKPFISSLKLQE